MSPRTILAALVAFAVFAPSLAAQAVRLPDSLKWTSLPSDPADFPAKVKAGSDVLSLFHGAGCPSDGGYAAAAYEALVKAAETDWKIRLKVARHHGTRLRLGPLCPNNLSGYEMLLTKWLRAEWEAGSLDQDKLDWQKTVGGEMLGMGILAHGTDPATYELLQSIARDPDVYVEPGMFRDGFSVDLRRFAARTMLDYRMNGGMGQAEALATVEADLAGAAPVYGWRPPGSEPPGS